METKIQNLKELYEKDFYLWVMENLKLLKNREFKLVDWENLLEEIEDMARRELRSLISFIAVIMEHLYKWENFRYREDVGHSWISSINNARNELLHKLSKAIIDENQVVVVEDINVKGLMQSNLAKSISDSSWSKFLTYLRYKAEWYRRTLIQVDKFFPSSKLCYCCGYKKEDLALHERTWVCPVCGKAHDRDVNASINLYLVGLERPEVKPVEHALVDDRIPYGIPKKPSCVEAGSSTFYKVE